MPIADEDQPDDHRQMRNHQQQPGRQVVRSPPLPAASAGKSAAGDSRQLVEQPEAGAPYDLVADRRRRRSLKFDRIGAVCGTIR